MSNSAISEQAGWSFKKFTCPTFPNERDWEAFRALITHLYLDCGHRLQDVIDVMLRDFNFRATKRMYNTRFRKWKILKNLGSHDVQEYLQRQWCPTKTTSDNTPSVMLRGRVVLKQKLLKHMRRRKTALEARLDGSEVPEGCPTKMTTSYRTSNMMPYMLPYRYDLRSYGIEPYEDFENISEVAEIEEELSSEELTSLHIAMLQTDFHYRQIEEDAVIATQATRADFEFDEQVLFPSTLTLSTRSLAGPQELRDLEFVLHNCNITYAHFPGLKQHPRTDSFKLSARQQSQAKDFYARHWLALSLLSKSSKTTGTSFKLLNQTNEQVTSILKENHPHFLPWIAFIVCYPGRFDWNKRLQHIELNFTVGMSSIWLQQTDPRRQIQQCLATSKFRKSICLVMLRQVIAIFRQAVQQSHLETLDLLARLFGNIEAHDNFDEDVVEETLQRWAESSLSLATLIKEDQKLAKLMAERENSDPVRQTAAFNIDSAWRTGSSGIL